jgi:hypothetical protein
MRSSFVFPIFLLLLPSCGSSEPNSDFVALDSTPPVSSPVDFKPLVKMANEFGLPAPPARSPLVLANTGWTTVLKSSSTDHDPGIYKPAFLLERLPDKKAKVLMGWKKTEALSDADHRPATRPFSFTPQKKKLLGYVTSFDDMNAFVMSVQLARRGDARAQKLYDHFRSAEYLNEDNFGEGIGRLRDTPEIFLARCLYQFLSESTLDPESNWKEIHRKLVSIRKRFPGLFSSKPEDFYAYRKHRFVEDLGLSVTAPKPKPGSVEELLVAWSKANNEMMHLGFMDENMDGDADPAREIFLRGVPAMHELTNYFEDTRLTRQIDPPFMKKPSGRFRLGKLAQNLHEEMQGGSPAPPAKGIKTGSREERDYFLSAAAEKEKGQISQLHEVPLWILSQRHPRALASLAATLPKSGTKELSYFALAGNIVEAKLPRADKIKALTGLVKRVENLNAKRGLLQHLAKIDSQSCIALLRPLFQSIPKDVNEPYWTSWAAGFTHVVAQLEDDGIWKEYFIVVKRSGIGLRMEMLNPLDYTYLGDKNLNRRLAFLAAFLNDTEVRDVRKHRKRYEGPHAGFTIDRLAMQNFAARKIASLLDLEDRPTEFWKKAQWKALREKVGRELKQRAIPDW